VHELIIESAALAEAAEACQWCAERSLQGADAFERAVEEAFEQILAAPLRWPIVWSQTHRYVMRQFPYVIAYLVEEKVVVVLAIAHAKRRPGYWAEREPPPRCSEHLADAALAIDPSPA
jgi:plasmid stabilization system protein ParE